MLLEAQTEHGIPVLVYRPGIIEVEGLHQVLGGAVLAQLLIQGGGGTAQTRGVLAVEVSTAGAIAGQIDGREQVVLARGIGVGTAHAEDLALQARGHGSAADAFIGVVAGIHLVAAAEEVMEDLQVQVAAAVVAAIGIRGDAETEGIGQSCAATRGGSALIDDQVLACAVVGIAAGEHRAGVHLVDAAFEEHIAGEHATVVDAVGGLFLGLGAQRRNARDVVAAVAEGVAGAEGDLAGAVAVFQGVVQRDGTGQLAFVVLVIVLLGVGGIDVELGHAETGGAGQQDGVHERVARLHHVGGIDVDVAGAVGVGLARDEDRATGEPEAVLDDGTGEGHLVRLVQVVRHAVGGGQGGGVQGTPGAATDVGADAAGEVVAA